MTMETILKPTTQYDKQKIKYLNEHHQSERQGDNCDNY